MRIAPFKGSCNDKVSQPRKRSVITRAIVMRVKQHAEPQLRPRPQFAQIASRPQPPFDRRQSTHAAYNRTLATYSAAQFTIDDVEVLVVLLDSSLESKSAQEKQTLYRKLQERASTGSVVALMWRDSHGRTRFLAPPEQHAFFQIVSYAQLQAQINFAVECE